MPRLDFYSDRERVVTVKLSESNIMIGRSADCDIQLPSTAISRHHARIIATSNGEHVVEDLSTNGTRVNAEMLQGSKCLEPGDRIYIEEDILIYQPDHADPEELEVTNQASTVYMKRPPGLS